MKNNVTLIGMPSAGKSTVGVLLAKRLGYSFIDVDLLIQEQEGKRLREIIEEQGLDGFLDVENRVNAGVEAEQAVIAPCIIRIRSTGTPLDWMGRFRRRKSAG